MTERTFPPEFCALMDQCRDTSAGLGHDHPITRRLWLLIEHTAPDMDLQPPARECDEHGKPVFSIADVAAHLGMSVEEAHRAVERLQADRAALGLAPHDLPAGGPAIHSLH